MGNHYGWTCISRPPNQQWQPKNQAQHTAATPQNDDFQPQKITNTHTYFDSPTSDQNGIDLSNKFQAFDELEQVEEAATMLHHNTQIRPHHDTKTSPNYQPMQQAVPINFISSPAEPKKHFKPAEACNPAAAPIPPPTDNALNKNNKNKAVMNTKTGAVPANNLTAAPTSARYIPPPVRHENTVHQRVNSSDTLSTECIPIGNNEAARINNNGDKEQSMAATHTPATHEKQGSTPSYVNILTSPPSNDPNAGVEHNLNRLRMEAQVLDPRNAYKKRSNAGAPPLTAAAGRLLIRKNTTKRK